MSGSTSAGAFISRRPTSSSRNRARRRADTSPPRRRRAAGSFFGLRFLALMPVKLSRPYDISNVSHWEIMRKSQICCERRLRKIAAGLPVRLRQVTAMAPGGGSQRGPQCGPAPVKLPVPRVRSWHQREVSLLVKRMLRASVLLIICRSWVRAPPAPPAVIRDIRYCMDGFVDRGGLSVDRHDLYPFRSQRATAERVVACQGARREGSADRSGDPLQPDLQDQGARSARPRWRRRSSSASCSRSRTRDANPIRALPSAGCSTSTPRSPGGRFHDGNQPRLHPPHHQARAGIEGSTQGSAGR
jgi:hypothetical protein